MNYNLKSKLSKENKTFSSQVAASANRKMNAQKNSQKGVWFGLGMMGLIGWSIVVPTLMGAAIGIWLDNKNGSENHSSINWTVALIMAGLSIGCFNAWNWVSKEDKSMHEEIEDHDE